MVSADGNAGARLEAVYAAIHADPRFQALQARRGRFSWGLAGIVLAAYYAFILVIAFRPALFARPLGADTVMTWGLPIGLGIIVLSFALTGVYVRRANGEFDAATQQIVSDALATTR